MIIREKKIESTTSDLLIYPISESAVTIEFGNTIDEALMNRINSFNGLLNQRPFGGMYDTVPAYTTLTVFYDPIQIIYKNELPGESCFEKVSGYLRGLKDEGNSAPIADGEVINIPVCYGGIFGADLEYVAGYHNLTPREVTELHSKAIYRVYMIGFIPGFAYLGGLNSGLETPRKATPRKTVPAGAVGIAGKQTGIYPLESPGGWQIIGQSPIKLFNVNNKPPALLKAGDLVRFEPISPDQFEKLSW